MKKSTAKIYKERIGAVLFHIRQHLDEEMSLDELAGIAHFSPYHFHRVFTGMVGESLKEHIRRLRLERAAMRLKHSDSSVLEIALEAGYETHEAFTRAFGAMAGCSPSAFRSEKQVTGEADIFDGRGSEIEMGKGDEAMNVEIRSLEPLRVAFVHHVGPYDEVGVAWDTLCTKLGAAGLLGGDTQFVGVCYDDPDVTSPEKIRYDACVTIDADFAGDGEVGVQTLAGGEYAVTHIGPYNQLGRTYAKLFGQWLPQSGRDLRSVPSLDFYLNDPDGTDPEDLITDIYAPLEPVL